jgi:hypothetical protein
MTQPVDDNPKAEYARFVARTTGTPLTYLEWLEHEYSILMATYVHPTIQECETMTADNAAMEMGVRVYNAAMFVERLEAAGKLLGNGHHFAQELSLIASERLRKLWHDYNPFSQNTA